MTLRYHLPERGIDATAMEGFTPSTRRRVGCMAARRVCMAEAPRARILRLSTAQRYLPLLRRAPKLCPARVIARDVCALYGLDSQAEEIITARVRALLERERVRLKWPTGGPHA